MLADITERLNLEGRLSSATHQNLGFQRLVADIATRFATVKPDAVDATIAEALREIAEALELDRAILWRHTTGKRPVSPLTTGWPTLSRRRPRRILRRRFRGCSRGWSPAKRFASREPRRFPIRWIVRHCDGRALDRRPCFPLHETATAPRVRSHSARRRGNRNGCRRFVERLRLVAGVISQALARKSSQDALDRALAELQQHPVAYRRGHRTAPRDQSARRALD